MTGLHAEYEHLLGLEQDLVDLAQGLGLLVLVAVVADGPDQRKAEVFLVHVLEAALDLINNSDGLHDILTDLIQIRFHNRLQRLDILGPFNNFQNRLPPTLQNMPVINNDLIHRHCQLHTDLLELTTRQIHPGL